MSYLRDFLELDNNLIFRSIINSDTFVEKYNGYFVDTSLGPVTVFLPSQVSIGDKVGICDYNGGFSSNDCIINGNGNNIIGTSSDYRCRVGNQSIIMVYVDVVQGWKVTENIVAGDITRRKNLLLNGNFEVWQRGTIFSDVGVNLHCDLWADHIQDTNGAIVSRQDFATGQTVVPNNPRYYHRTVVQIPTTCNTHGNMDSVFFLSGKKATLSFWAKVDSDKNIAVSFVQSFGENASYSPQVRGIAQQWVPITTDWKKYVITIDVPSITGKIINYQANNWFTVIFWFSGHPGYDDETASLPGQTGTFDIAQVQLEEGDTATKFEYRTYGEELLSCQRYFEIMEGTVNTSSNMYKDFYFKVKKRELPTISNIGYTNIGSGATFDIRYDRLIQLTAHSVSSKFYCWVDGFTDLPDF